MDYPSDPAEQFLAASAALTAFEVVELQGTGMSESYWNLLLGRVGSGIAGEFLSACGSAFAKSRNAKELEAALGKRVMNDPKYGPIAQRIITLWYMGTWSAMPSAWSDTYGSCMNDVSQVVSPKAYREGLVWPAFGTHPQAAKPMGYGSWSYPPLVKVNTDAEP